MVVMVLSLAAFGQHGAGWLIAATPPAVGSQLLAALVVGLLTAFALQLLLTNLGVAVGISALGFWSADASPQAASAPDATEAEDETDASSGSNSSGSNAVGVIGFAAGSGILLTINTVLFAACWLATRFSQVQDPVAGAITGIVIWSAYFLLLTWASSTAISSLVGSLLGSAAGGFRQIVSTVSAALSQSDAEPLTEARAIATIRQEIQAAISGADVQQTLESYLQTVAPPPASAVDWRHELEQVLADLDAEQIAQTSLNREQIVELLHQRTQRPVAELEPVAAQLESAWTQVAERSVRRDRTAELRQWLESAAPEELEFDHLAARLESPVPSKDALETSNGHTNGTNGHGEGRFALLKQIDLDRLKQAVLNRVDLSDLDVETVWNGLQTLQQKWLDFTAESDHEPEPFSVIRADVEAYLRRAYPWQLTDERVQTEFRDVLYDPEAAPEQVRRQLEQLHADEFTATLQQRDDLTEDEIQQITTQLKAIQTEVLETVKAAEIEEQKTYLEQRLKQSLSSISAVALKPEQWLQNLPELLAESGIAIATAATYFQESGRWKSLLAKAVDWTETEWAQLDDQLHHWREAAERPAEVAAEMPELLQSANETLAHQLDAYLRYTNLKQLTPEKIEQKVQALWDAACEQVPAPHASRLQIDQDAIAAVLQRRKGLRKKQRKAIQHQIETTWEQVTDAIAASSTAVVTHAQHTATETADMADRLVAWVTQTLERMDLDNRSLDALKDLVPDLLRLMASPVAGAWVLRHQLSQLDWDDLSQRLQQVSGMPEAQIRPLLKWLKARLYPLVKAPRRWASRAASRTQDFAAHVQDYLQQADKSALHSERLQQTLERLWTDTLETVDHSTVVQQLTSLQPDRLRVLLQQRPDLSELEVGAIASQIASLGQQFQTQISPSAASSDPSLLDQVAAQVDHALESFSLPDLSEIDLPNLKDVLSSSGSALSMLQNLVGSVVKAVPQGKFDEVQQTLRSSLQQLAQEAVLTWLQAQHWPTAAYRVVAERAEEIAAGLRQQLLQHIEQLQQETYRRLEETRRAAAAAAWWLFSTAFTGALSAAIAGATAAGTDWRQLAHLWLQSLPGLSS